MQAFREWIHSSDEPWPWLWFWLPGCVLALQILCRVLDTEGGFYLSVFEGELGVIELLTAVILIPGIYAGVHLARWFASDRQYFLSIWFAGGAFACFAFLGEEISWGQHLLGFSSPEFFLDNNIQQETNLHNFSKGIERTLKAIVGLTLVIGVFAGVRWRSRNKGETLSNPVLNSILPGVACVPSIVLAITVYSLERFRTWFHPDWGVMLEIALKETFEMYLAFVLAVYMILSLHRHKAPAVRSD